MGGLVRMGNTFLSRRDLSVKVAFLFFVEVAQSLSLVVGGVAPEMWEALVCRWSPTGGTTKNKIRVARERSKRTGKRS
ncbi:MAG: hypothetical protein ACYS18_09440 [Planctomycetota bacterium]